MRIVVAIHDPPVWSIPPSSVRELAGALPDDEILDARDAASRRALIPTADVLFATRLRPDEVAGARRLRWIHSSAVGVGGVLVPGVVDRPVIVTNARGLYSEAIAEHALSLLLALRRGLPRAFASQIERRWAQQELSTREAAALSHSTLLVVGLGSIGGRVAAMASALGMRVLGIRRRLDQPVPAGVSEVAAPDRLPDLLPSADALVLAAPTTSSTRTMMGEREFRLMKRTAFLVNVARGRLVDEPALARALERRELAGAGLDAFQREPLAARQSAVARAKPADHAAYRRVRGRLLAPGCTAVSRQPRPLPPRRTAPQRRRQAGGLLMELPTIALLPFFASGRFPKPVLLGRCRAGGIDPISGRELVERVRDISLGLSALGMAGGDRVAIVAESRPEWLLADLAVLAGGGVTVPVYPTLAPAQVAFVLRDSGASLAIVSTPGQLDKVLEVGRDLPALRTIVCMDPPPRWPDWSGAIGSLADAADRGHRRIMDGWGIGREFHDAARRVAPSDLATIIYTSGTTGEPKGVELTHANLVADLEGIQQALALDEDDLALSFLPLCHAFERMVAYVYLASGVTMLFAESLDTVPRDLVATRPTVITGVPRVFEKLYDRILATGRGGGAVSRRVFDLAVRVADARGASLGEGAPAPWWSRSLTGLADRLVFRAVRAAVGGRLRFAVSGSAPLRRDIARRLLGMGVPVIEGYGLTETAPVLCVTRLDAIRLGSVGTPIAGVQLRMADDGEVLARGPNVMARYHDRPDDTARALEGGWFHTGDLGRLDADGALWITGRKKELMVTSGGKKIAPEPIEAALRRHPLVAEAMLVADGRRFPAALIVPEAAALAREAGEPPPGDDAAARALVARPEVVSRFQRIVDDVNRPLAHFEQIKRFALLPRAFTIAAGELTPTLKVRRSVIEERYRAEIDGLY